MAALSGFLINNKSCNVKPYYPTTSTIVGETRQVKHVNKLKAFVPALSVPQRYRVVAMAKKKGKKGGGKIPLESAVDSDLDEREVGARGKAWSDPMFAQEEEDTRELRNRMANAGGGDRGRQSAYGDSSVVFGISDSDSEEDAEVTARKRRKAEKKAMKKKGKGRQQQEEQEDDFASDLDEGGPSAPYEDELVGGEGWGKRKRHFYGGNPNERRPDKEKDRKKGDKGEEEEDEAEMEAQESRKLQARQLEDMDEGDFLDAFATPAAEGGKVSETNQIPQFTIC